MVPILCTRTHRPVAMQGRCILVYISCHTFVSPRGSESKMQDESISPKHRSGGECVPQHSTRRLEARFEHQHNHIWTQSSFRGAVLSGSTLMQLIIKDLSLRGWLLRRCLSSTLHVKSSDLMLGLMSWILCSAAAV